MMTELKRNSLRLGNTNIVEILDALNYFLDVRAREYSYPLSGGEVRATRGGVIPLPDNKKICVRKLNGAYEISGFPEDRNFGEFAGVAGRLIDGLRQCKSSEYRRWVEGGEKIECLETAIRKI